MKDEEYQKFAIELARLNNEMDAVGIMKIFEKCFEYEDFDFDRLDVMVRAILEKDLLN